MSLDVQSTTIKDYAELNGLVYIFSANGVDIYEPSYVSWRRVGFASLSNVTSGAVNDNGVWLGTSDRGVWHCPDGRGELTSQLRQYYAVTGTAYNIQDNNISSLAGIGTKLLVCHASGAEYFPAVGTPYQYSDEATDNAAINGTYIAYSVATGLETLAFPSDDWDSTDATVLTTSSSPALTSNTVNGLKYGSGNNLFVAGGSGVDVYNYSTVTNIGTGVIDFVWPGDTATSSAGYMAYVDGSDDVVSYDIAGAASLATVTGTYTVCWCNTKADLVLSDDELNSYSLISNLSPAPNTRDVSRDWSFYAEVTDSVDDITTAANVTLKVNGVTVSPTKTAITDGYKLTYTPASSTGYRKTVSIEISVTDDSSNTFSETYTFTTAAAVNTSPSATLPPSVIVYKDLSLTEYEDVYNSVEVNWLDEHLSAYIVSESQAAAMATVEVEKGIYHQHTLTLRVYDTDASSNATQDIKRGDILTIDVTALGLSNKKCEVLAKQRVVQGDRIEYNLVLAYYEVWS